MSKGPLEIADRIRAQRRVLVRVLRISVPLTLVGFAGLFAAGSRLSDPLMTFVIVPTLLAFFTSWVSMLGLWFLGVRDFRNLLRPGSAGAYEKDR